METSPGESRPIRGVSPTSVQTAAFDLCELANSLVVADEASAIAALELAARVGGADAAMFVWVIPDDDRCRYRSIAALDHDWSASALRRLHSGPRDWLGHVARSSEPVLVHETIDENDETIGEETADSRHQRATWLIPAPPPRGSDVFGLLLLAGEDEQRLAIAGRLMPVFRALALALSDWFQRRGRDELVVRARLTATDIDLLRRELRGQCSKRIADALNTRPKAIDTRFHRLIGRLGVASRRDAVRLCRRYGLL